MYPIFRLLKEVFVARRQPPLAPFGEHHVSHHICWPWDIDMFMEMNNGRILTVYDFGRFGAAQRIGLLKAIMREKWTLTMAGAVVRYRRRLTLSERFTVKSHAVCWDDRFVYLEQSMWKKNGECASHVVYRAAVLRNGKLVPTQEVADALGFDGPRPPVPDWIKAWSDAEALRPWPPMQDAGVD